MNNYSVKHLPHQAKNLFVNHLYQPRLPLPVHGEGCEAGGWGFWIASKLHICRDLAQPLQWACLVDSQIALASGGVI